MQAQVYALKKYKMGTVSSLHLQIVFLCRFPIKCCNGKASIFICIYITCHVETCRVETCSMSCRFSVLLSDQWREELSQTQNGHCEDQRVREAVSQQCCGVNAALESEWR